MSGLLMKGSKVLILAPTFLLSGCAALNGKSSDSRNPDPPDLSVVSHIVYMLQENQGFDHYFGQLNTYRQSQGFAADVDAMPAGASQVSYDHSTSFTPFHMRSMCVEELSSYWNESHNAWNDSDPTSATPLMDGFAISAGNDSRNQVPTGYDINGQRVMGFYDSSDLPYYYFMATQFAISDRWFSPVMTNTTANRMYAVAATSHGVVSKPLTQINVPTIFDQLEHAKITWKNYVPDYPQGSSLKPFSTFSKYVGSRIVPMPDYFTDLANDTLPQVAFIDRESKLALDEHPGAGNNIQKGAAYVTDIINALMNSTSWKSSIFFLAYDEGGGFYDHVPPVLTVSPDNIPPVLLPSDTCVTASGPNCDFVYTGFRLPNFVVSPFSKPHYVDHTPIDTTAILHFIEVRFRLQPLTKRDAAQPDISFFFDFSGKPNLHPPSPPIQPTSGPCYTNTLP